MFKKIIAATALTVASFGAIADDVKSPHIVDYSWGVISANSILGNQELNYAEIEGGFGKGNFDVYGFFDLNDDGSTFSKLNASYNLGSGVFVEGTNKLYTNDNFRASDTFAGIGYKINTDTGFVKASVNRHLDGGWAVLSAGSVATGLWDTRVDGWFDVVKKNDAEVDKRGNVGIRKSLSDSFYIRGAAHYTNGDVAPHFQLGYMI